jgi:hypothetical protein
LDYSIKNITSRISSQENNPYPISHPSIIERGHIK